MGFALDTGYTPLTIADLMSIVRENINTQFGTSYTVESFIGSNFYKYFYALIQRLQENEVKASEIFLRMQEYFVVTNEKVLRPNTTHPGIYDYFAAAGYLVSTKPPADADAGKLYVCVNVDSGASDYATTKLILNNLVKDCCVGGVISQGTESSTITLANGQSFAFKYNLPDKHAIKLKLTIVQSENNLFTIDTPEAIRQRLYDNITASYKLGKNFEPQRYYSIIDAPWAATVLLQYSLDGGSTWLSVIYDADYDDLLTFALSDITLVES